MNHLIAFPSQLFVKVEKNLLLKILKLIKSPNLCHDKRNIIQEEKTVYTFNENAKAL